VRSNGLKGNSLEESEEYLGGSNPEQAGSPEQAEEVRNPLQFGRTLHKLSSLAT
jgi:hypothetical protein